MDGRRDPAVLVRLSLHFMAFRTIREWQVGAIPLGLTIRAWLLFSDHRDLGQAAQAFES